MLTVTSTGPSLIRYLIFFLFLFLSVSSAIGRPPPSGSPGHTPSHDPDPSVMNGIDKLERNMVSGFETVQLIDPSVDGYRFAQMATSDLEQAYRIIFVQRPVEDVHGWKFIPHFFVHPVGIYDPKTEINIQNRFIKWAEELVASKPGSTSRMELYNELWTSVIERGTNALGRVHDSPDLHNSWYDGREAAIHVLDKAISEFRETGKVIPAIERVRMH